MVASGLHFPFKDPHVHIKIPDTFVCFSPVALSYVHHLILRPVTGPKGVEADYTSQLKNAQERGWHGLVQTSAQEYPDRKYKNFCFFQKSYSLAFLLLECFIRCIHNVSVSQYMHAL